MTAKKVSPSFYEWSNGPIIPGLKNVNYTVPVIDPRWHHTTMEERDMVILSTETPFGASVNKMISIAVEIHDIESTQMDNIDFFQDNVAMNMITQWLKRIDPWFSSATNDEIFLKSFFNDCSTLHPFTGGLPMADNLKPQQSGDHTVFERIPNAYVMEHLPPKHIVLIHERVVDTFWREAKRLQSIGAPAPLFLY
jgi:hypothetical protein